MDTDYSELVEGTVEEVKDRVREDDFDLQKVLEAERENKNRITLVNWLEDRIEEGGGSQRDRTPGIVGRMTTPEFVAGLLIGLVIAGGAMATGSGLSPSAAGEQVEKYFEDNSQDIPLENVSVEDIGRLEGSQLYRARMVISAEFLNRTVRQNRTVIISPSGRYIFFNRPIDTSAPLSQQLGGSRTRSNSSASG
ncbi:MAG: hypothetical protein SVS85_00720 [Candidatus Nanohaloarchaea archaeon]|nr:hypothetical protein [Candidatus Nanohaloarchaea archaeon]